MTFTWHALKELPLFSQFSETELTTMMDCFCGEIQTLSANETFFGDTKHAFCILKGNLGNIEIGKISPMPSQENPLVAMEDSEILVLENHMLLYPCYGCCCFFHVQLLENMKQMGTNLHTLNSR